MSPDLCTHKTGARRLAKWWTTAIPEAEIKQAVSGQIEVREDAIFADQTWLNLGNITLRLPQFDGAASPEGWTREEHFSAALLDGGYEWAVPQAKTLEAALIKSVGAKVTEKGDTSAAGRVRDAIGYAILRLGLEMPLLDAHALSKLPFPRPVTLVADTNAVLQGGIHFCVRFLYPMSRLRIPEPVHAELSNQAAQYFATRRTLKADGDRKAALPALRQRLTSQGGLRALLRVQLQSGVEIERLQVEAEEPRGFNLTGDTKGGDRSTVPDRMILETALRHRALIAPGHPVRIMTSDQGMARSALIEGIEPLYFPPRRWESLFGRTYFGASFAPLPSATASIWHRVPLTEVLWELAACFGSARLRLADGAYFAVTATRFDLPWSSFHACEDLLWVESAGTDGVADQIEERTPISIIAPPRDERAEPPRLVAPKFSAENLLSFWNWLAMHRSGTLKQAAKALGLTDKTTRDYPRLMASGGFLKLGEEKIDVDGESFDPLWTALRGGDWDALRERLLRLPAFAAFCDELSANMPVRPENLRPIREAALPGFQRLGEICGAILSIPEVGLCFCEPRPSLDTFCPKALEAYAESVAADSSAKPLVHSGAWLEMLALRYRVHPLFAPALLQEAITARRLDVVFEGSQPFREKANHVFRRIIWQKDSPVLEEVPLYRGDYLAANRASVHMKIESSTP